MQEYGKVRPRKQTTVSAGSALSFKADDHRPLTKGFGEHRNMTFEEDEGGTEAGKDRKFLAMSGTAKTIKVQ